MATMQAATTSTGAIVSDPGAVEALLDEYWTELNTELTETGEITIWGFGTLTVYPADEDGEPAGACGNVAETFLKRLAGLLEDGEELDIQTAGFTKCRYPLLAQRYVLRDGEVLKATLDNPEPIE